MEKGTEGERKMREKETDTQKERERENGHVRDTRDTRLANTTLSVSWVSTSEHLKGTLKKNTDGIGSGWG